MRTGHFAGRLGKDAELKYTQQGKAICNFSLAVDAGWGDNKKTLWVDCAIWEERATKLAPFLTKGKFVAVQGEVDVRCWISKNTGEAGCSLGCTVRQLTLGPGGERNENSSGSGSSGPQEPQAAQPISDDDIPF